MKARLLALAAASALSLGPLTTGAGAATVINGAGASAGNPLGSTVPVLLCDQSPTPEVHINGTIVGPPAYSSGRMASWKCKRNGEDIIIRYHGSASANGIQKIRPPINDAAATEVQINEEDLTGCVGPVLKNFRGRDYNEYTGCQALLVGGGTGIPSHYGLSDVRGATFNQTGPFPTHVVKPEDEADLVRVPAGITPFDIVLGTGVVQPTTDGTAVAGPVQTLSRLQVEQLVSRQVTDWRQIGLATCTGANYVNKEMCAPGSPLDATSAATVCHRAAESGTKAAFDATVMKDVGENIFGTLLPTTNSNPGAYFGISNSEVRDCIRGVTGISPNHPTAIGYMEAEQAIAAALTGPNGRPQNLYRTKLNGYLSYDLTAGPDVAPWLERKKNVICGRHLYWSTQNMYRRPDTAPNITAAELALLQAYLAEVPGNINFIPAGRYWVQLSDMNVSKNADPGPVLNNALPAKAVCMLP
jgi:ABC-type phosphate transport system substrate-binding protein